MHVTYFPGGKGDNHKPATLDMKFSRFNAQTLLLLTRKYYLTINTRYIVS
jgi:hypothetical protein